MQTFIFQGKLPVTSLREAAPIPPTKALQDIIQNEGGQVQCCYSTSGRFQVIAIAELDNAETAQKVALAVQRHAGLLVEWGHAVEALKFETVWNSSLSAPAPSRRER